MSVLGQAAPGSIVNTASLEGLSHAVYAMAVQGSKVYSGLYNGNIQVWHMDAYINLPSGSRPEYHTLSGHSSSIYALVVTERQLVSASHDKLIKVWDLNTMRCRHTSWLEKAVCPVGRPRPIIAPGGSSGLGCSSAPRSAACAPRKPAVA